MASQNVTKIKVTVSASGALQCAPDPASVKGANALLAFELDTDDYKFPNTAAVVVSSPGDDFPYASWTLSSEEAALYDENNDKVQYAYTVTVVHKHSGQVLSVDPTIVNEGGTTEPCA
jgi:hypothetical protein